MFPTGIDPTMARKKTHVDGTPDVPPLATSVKIDPGLHSKLKIISSVEGRNISSIVNEILRGPVEKLYRDAFGNLPSIEPEPKPKRGKKPAGE
jgi:hypothetical protein